MQTPPSTLRSVRTNNVLPAVCLLLRDFHDAQPLQVKMADDQRDAGLSSTSRVGWSRCIDLSNKLHGPCRLCKLIIQKSPGLRWECSLYEDLKEAITADALVAPIMPYLTLLDIVHKVWVCAKAWGAEQALGGGHLCQACSCPKPLDAAHAHSWRRRSQLLRPSYTLSTS